jgi:hypothetical protein
MEYQAGQAIDAPPELSSEENLQHLFPTLVKLWCQVHQMERNTDCSDDSGDPRDDEVIEMLAKIRGMICEVGKPYGLGHYNDFISAYLFDARVDAEADTGIHPADIRF